jgi:hypothetical protein
MTLMIAPSASPTIGSKTTSTRSMTLSSKDGLLIIVFDESSSDNSNGGGHHENVLRLMFEGLGITTLSGAAANTSTMWNFSSY